MATSPQQSNLSISTRDVQRQFARRGQLADAEFLYGEIAQRMLERLKLIRLAPAVIVDAGCGHGARFEALAQRYPQAQIIGVDHNEQARSRTTGAGTPWWKRWVTPIKLANKPKVVCADLADTGLAPESVDLVWSNLALHWHPAPHDVLREWSRLLRPDGLVFFSGWGPASGQEIRQALAAAKLQTATLPLVDMHDLGDIMVEQGFADPVMDQETITLTYDSAQALLNDARALGGNPNPARKASLPSRQWLDRLLAALNDTRGSDGKLRLTLEVAYGHAWRGAIRQQQGEAHISVQSITRKPKPAS